MPADFSTKNNIMTAFYVTKYALCSELSDFISFFRGTKKNIILSFWHCGFDLEPNVFPFGSE